jgi:hypothetical protein
MKVGIIQSCYMPWRGYFDFIDDVDLFILFDDIPYSPRSWRNRNQVKTSTGLKWLSVPVKKGARGELIDHVLIGTSEKPWQSLHRRLLTESLENAPHFKEALALWEDAIGGGEAYLSRLNETLIRNICRYLDITTPIVRARDYSAEGHKTARLIELLQKAGATSYLSGPAALDYLEEDAFRQADIALSYKTYDYEPYPQLWGGFEGAVTVLDLIANCGGESRKYLKSATREDVRVPAHNGAV